jgi:hypothetical protein
MTTGRARRRKLLRVNPPRGGAMTRRTRITAIAAAGAVACAAAAVPALTGAQAPPSPRDVTVLMKVLGGHEVAHAKKPRGKMSPGDQLIVRTAMFNTSGARVGSAYLSCVGVGKKAPAAVATQQCTQTYEFKDGQVVGSAILRFDEIEKLSAAIVGGSGTYSGANGQVTSTRPPKGYDSADILHLEG